MKTYKTVGEIERKISSIDKKFRKYSTKAKKIKEHFEPRRWDERDRYYVEAKCDDVFFDCRIGIMNQDGVYVKHITIR